MHRAKSGTLASVIYTDTCHKVSDAHLHGAFLLSTNLVQAPYVILAPSESGECFLRRSNVWQLKFLPQSFLDMRILVTIRTRIHTTT